VLRKETTEKLLPFPRRVCCLIKTLFSFSLPFQRVSLLAQTARGGRICGTFFNKWKSQDSFLKSENFKVPALGRFVLSKFA